MDLSVACVLAMIYSIVAFEISNFNCKVTYSEEKITIAELLSLVFVSVSWPLWLFLPDRLTRIKGPFPR
jgi:hypothetical protein